jgi:hypothetical protein
MVPGSGGELRVVSGDEDEDRRSRTVLISPFAVGFLRLRRASQSSAPEAATKADVCERAPSRPMVEGMCRNITTLRGLEPEATAEEIEAAARQFVRTVSGVHAVSDHTREPFEAAVAEITAITTRLLAELPVRRQPPTTVPPLRRPEVKARLAVNAAQS